MNYELTTHEILATEHSSLLLFPYLSVFLCIARHHMTDLSSMGGMRRESRVLDGLSKYTVPSVQQLTYIEKGILKSDPVGRETNL